MSDFLSATFTVDLGPELQQLKGVASIDSRFRTAPQSEDS